MFGISLSKEDLEQAKNPFSKEEVIDKLGDSKLNFIDGLKEEEILQDPKGGKILESLQKFEVCEGVEVKEFNANGQKMKLKAKNWNQVVFLRKFLPNGSLSPDVSKLVEGFTKSKGAADVQGHLKGIIPEQASGYKAEQKKDFPDMVSVESSGFDLTVKWQSSDLAFKAFEQAKDLKEKSAK